MMLGITAPASHWTYPPFWVCGFARLELLSSLAVRLLLPSGVRICPALDTALTRRVESNNTRRARQPLQEVSVALLHHPGFGICLGPGLVRRLEDTLKRVLKPVQPETIPGISGDDLMTALRADQNLHLHERGEIDLGEVLPDLSEDLLN